ncbi:MAG TPA: pantetheine-phosphate adenylyltransferase [Verrucomicrobiae bacterium]|nr:pantetheine-phosphate adenylyltransferase [Verrucomicrobiae bacterium]
MDRPERVALYPGSFDPLTNGHLDVTQRALELFDRVIVGIAVHTPKTTLFTAQERMALAREALAGAGDRVEIVVFEGLLINFARRRQVTAIVRGLRAVADFEFEFQLALVNRNFAPEIETIFLMPKESLIYLSSSLIKEISQLDGDVSALVPPNVDRALRVKFRATR